MISKLTSCQDYCNGFGQVCFYAAGNIDGPAGQSVCKAEKEAACVDDMSSLQPSAGSMICGCRNPDMSDMSTSPPAATLAPPTPAPPTPAPPLTPPPPPRDLTCKEFADWPGHKGDSTDCGTCKHFVQISDFMSCDDYCSSFDQECWF